MKFAAVVGRSLTILFSVSAIFHEKENNSSKFSFPSVLSFPTEEDILFSKSPQIMFIKHFDNWECDKGEI